MKMLCSKIMFIVLGLILTNNTATTISTKTKPFINNFTHITAIGAKTKPPANNAVVIAGIGAKTKPPSNNLITAVPTVIKKVNDYITL
jgi:hypothetical protein